MLRYFVDPVHILWQLKWCMYLFYLHDYNNYIRLTPNSQVYDSSTIKANFEWPQETDWSPIVLHDGLYMGIPLQVRWNRKTEMRVIVHVLDIKGVRKKYWLCIFMLNKIDSMFDRSRKNTKTPTMPMIFESII